MQIALITNDVGKGLTLDAHLLRDYLATLGHESTVIQFDQPHDGEYDLGVSLEVVAPHLMKLSQWNVWIPNPEWTTPRYLANASSFDQVWCKTREAERIFHPLFHRVRYIGFLSRDRRDATPREPRALHVGGDNAHRNTNAVLAAWREYRYWDHRPLPPLTIVSSAVTTVFEATPDVTLLKRVDDDQLRDLQNRCLFHIQPSATEGYGHALREAQSCGGIILTTAAAPMTDLEAPFSVLPTSHKKVNLAQVYEIAARDVRERAGAMAEQPSQVLARMRAEARARWERDQQESKNLITEALGSLMARPQAVSVGKGPEIYRPPISKPKLALIGNFGPPHSTENDLLWTLQDMGHEVVAFQEDKDTTDDMAETDAALVIYVHTHGWVTPGSLTLDHLWQTLRSHGIKTCSFHLDRYWGLNILDRREDKIGEHPFWRTDAVFTADGGNQQRFAGKGIVHHWLPPGVVRRDCYLGTPREDLRIDVGFVGATGYHPEYPFRGELIEFLKETYGERFRVFQGYRGNSLNDLYESIRVVVGDSCFGGSDYYWSDRVPETLGRGGFLIHPASKGLTIPGLVTFAPTDLRELRKKIDYYLDAFNYDERDNLQMAAHNWVKKYETYHNRMETLLRVMECQ